jgi:hypothetical protein
MATYHEPPVDLELARHQWEDGNRRVEDARRDRARQLRLIGEVDAVTRELRRRLGQTFTLQELADAYAGSDRWVRETLDDVDPDGRPALDAATAADAAFHLYARGALDYAP